MLGGQSDVLQGTGHSATASDLGGSEGGIVHRLSKVHSKH